MKRLHVYLAAADLELSIGFYSTVFGWEPAEGSACCAPEWDTKSSSCCG